MADTKDTDTINDWLNFLAQQGATINDGLATSFGETPADYPTLKATLVDLSDLGILALEGADTKRFLQGQSTSDTSQLNTETSLPGAICNPKGRMLTSYQAIEPVVDAVLLVMHRPLVEITINSLSKYAAFFKTTLNDVSEDYRLLGLSGPDCEPLLDQLFDTVPQAINQLCIGENYLLLRISAQQFLLVVDVTVAERHWQRLSATFKPVGIDYWQLQSIRAGLAQVRAETLEQFVPQMLNLQATGAVSFKKGCYTGQEIVARMQYLGKLKRRTYRVIIEDTKPPRQGAEIYSSSDNKLVGSVLSATPADDKSSEVLAILHEEQADTTSLIIDGKTTAVRIADLPYTLTTD
ncbi:MAG: folate-binding protein YgfZ [Candidatus Reddybacter sp.]